MTSPLHELYFNLKLVGNVEPQKLYHQTPRSSIKPIVRTSDMDGFWTAWGLIGFPFEFYINPRIRLACQTETANVSAVQYLSTL